MYKYETPEWCLGHCINDRRGWNANNPPHMQRTYNCVCAACRAYEQGLKDAWEAAEPTDSYHCACRIEIERLM
jgi:hypothetical protein